MGDFFRKRGFTRRIDNLEVFFYPVDSLNADWTYRVWTSTYGWIGYAQRPKHGTRSVWIRS